MLSRAVFFLLCATACAVAAPPLSPEALERYKRALAANPVEGPTLERIWTSAESSGATQRLIDEYAARDDFASGLILGRFLQRARRDAEALAAFQRAALQNPQSPLPHLALADLHRRAGDYAASASAAETAAGLLPPGDARLPELLLSAGDARMVAHQREAAVALWERAAAVAPRQVEIRRKLAAAYLQHDLLDEASRHLAEIETLGQPAERVEALRSLAGLHAAAGRMEQAAATLERAAGMTLPGSWVWNQVVRDLIRLHQRAGTSAQLRSQWEKQALAAPRDLGAALRLLELVQREGDLPAQEAQLQRLTAALPKNAEHKRSLARLQVRLGRPEEAVRLYDELARLQPRDLDLVFERAELFVQLHRLSDAQAAVEAQLASGGDALRVRALEFFRTHRLRAAEEKLHRAAAGAGDLEAVLGLIAFLLGQGREAEAEAEVARLLSRAPAATERSALLVKVAELYASQQRIAQALEHLAQAAAAVESSPRLSQPIWQRAGEIQLAAGRYAAAWEALSRAAALEPGPPPAALDQKLFDCLRQAEDEAARFRARGLPGADSERRAEETALPGVASFLDRLTSQAAAANTAAAWMRVAQWRSWNREQSVAAQCVGKALQLEPKSVVARELAVRIGAGGDSYAVLDHLRQLSELDPANAASYRRRAAQTELQAGRPEAAIEIYRQMSAENPADVDLLVDLAQTQERLERWPEALAAWERASAVLPPTRRREAALAMVRLHERLGDPAAGGRTLLAELETRLGSPEQGEWFDALFAHVEKHSLGEWLLQEWQRLRRQRREELFVQVAQSRILKLLGRRSEALDLLRQAVMSAAEPLEALPQLVREAEEMRRPADALAAQLLLTRLGARDDAAALEKLAELQEKNFDPDAAAATWRRLAEIFPRDAGLLRKAADFHLRGGEMAEAIPVLRTMVDLEPQDHRARLSLAQAQVQLGQTAEAVAALEAILIATRPSAEKPAVRFPGLQNEDAGRLQSAYLKLVHQRGGEPDVQAMRALRVFWVDSGAPARTDDDLRFTVIRELARLRQAQGDPVALEEWARHWTRPEVDPSEALHALHFAGLAKPALAAAIRLRDQPGSGAHFQQGFVWMALQAQAFAELGAWAHAADRTAGERDLFMMALGKYLDENAVLPPAALEELFPPGRRSRLWQSASLLASRARFTEAIALGRRAYAEDRSRQSAGGVELARWLLYSGAPGEARDVLAETSEMPGDSFESSVYAALREAWLLSSPGDRVALLEKSGARLDADSQRLHEPISRLLIAGFQNDRQAVRFHTRALLAVRPLLRSIADDDQSSSARAWAFVSEAVSYFQAWRMDDVAQMICEEALRDGALIRLQGEQAREAARGLRTRWYAMRLARAAPVDVAALLGEFTRGTPSADRLVELGEQIDSLGATPRAIPVFYQAWQADPGNPRPLTSLLAACRTCEDDATAETVLRASLARRAFALNINAQRDQTLQLADLLEKRGAWKDSSAILETAVREAPYDARLLQRHAQALRSLGDIDAAERAWHAVLRLEAQNAVAAIALAEIEMSRGETGGAIKRLQNGRSPEAVSRLAALLAGEGRYDEALSALDRLPAGARPGAALKLADAVSARGEPATARILLQDVAARLPAAGSSTLLLQEKVIATLQPSDPRRLILRELRKMRSLAGEDLLQLGAYYAALQTQAPRLGIAAEAQEELRAAWAQGAGPIPAGAVLLAHALDTNSSEVSALLDQLLARADIGDHWLKRVVAALDGAQRSDLCARARARLVEINPLEDDRIIHLADELRQAGQEGEAVAVLQRWGARASLSGESAGRFAPVYARHGLREEARALFSQAVREDPAARFYPVHLEFARMLREEGDWRTAGQVLAAAYGNPSNRNFEELRAWMSAAGLQSNPIQAIAGFRLGPERTREVLAALRQASVSQR